jgi:hypothetical protein
MPIDCEAVTSNMLLGRYTGLCDGAVPEKATATVRSHEKSDAVMIPWKVYYGNLDTSYMNPLHPAHPS